MWKRGLWQYFMASLAIIYMKHRLQYYSNCLIQMQSIFAQAEVAADIVVVAQARFTPPLKGQLRLQDHKQSLLPVMHHVKCLQDHRKLKA